jgi:dephospho-CoA kinase
MTLRVGLTGGMASGKSTVARMLRERGATVVDADRLVASLYEPGEPGARAVAELFGPEALDERGAVDRERVAELVFHDPAGAESRHRLEEAIHPLVRQRFARLAEEAAEGADTDLVVLEATLLVEAGYGPGFDTVVTVEADPEVRLERAIGRGMAPEEARRRLLAQGEGDVRRAGADRVIRNDGTLEDLERKVDELLAELRD